LIDCRTCINFREAYVYDAEIEYYCMVKIRREWKNPVIRKLTRKKCKHYHPISLTVLLNRKT